MQKFSQVLPGLPCVDSVLFEQEKIFLAKYFAKVYNIPRGKIIGSGYEMDDKIVELIK